MAHSGTVRTLNPAQRRAVAALLQARTIEQAAQAAGVALRSLKRWLTWPEFRHELRQAEDELLAAAVRALVCDLAPNLAVMRAIRDDQAQPAAVRLRAAQALDQSAARWHELQALDQRISELEKAVIYDKQANP